MRVDQPFVSVVIPTHNSVKTLEACLSSLSNQTYPKDRYEVILVDNGSTDGTCALVTAEYPWVQLIHSAEKGSGFARNAGVQQSVGELILSTDSDCVADAAWILQIVNAFASADPGVAAIGGTILPYATATAVERHRPAWVTQPGAECLRTGVRYAATPNAGFRAGILRRVGGFDGACGHDDTDFGIRLLQAGYRVEYTNEARVQHRNPRTLAELYQHRQKYGGRSFTLSIKHPQLLGNPTLAGVVNRLLWATIRRVAGDLFLKLPIALVGKPKGRPRIWPFIDAAMALGNFQGFARAAKTSHRTEVPKPLPAGSPGMKLTVLIATYNRPDHIDAALASLTRQTRLPDQVVVVTRETDHRTIEVAVGWKSRLPVDVLTVVLPGTIEALQRGLDGVTGTIVSITDDDALPHADWLARIEAHFQSDPLLGGLGGRDIVTTAGTIIPPRDVPVGVVCWYGRLLGNHHVGMGHPREVDFLKGVNMSLRMTALGIIRLDRDIRGQGAPAFEPPLSLAIKNAGWRLVYDPAVAVDHYPAHRPTFDSRDRLSMQATEEKTFNYYLTIRRYLHPQSKRVAALLWARLIGTPYAPGLVRGTIQWLKGHGTHELRASQRMWKEARAVALPRAQ